MDERDRIQAMHVDAGIEQGVISGAPSGLEPFF